LIGGIIGDVIGSVYEFDDNKPKYDIELFERNSHFTDDTILLVANMDSILNNISYEDKLKEYYNKYPYLSFGRNFKLWGMNILKGPYDSYGNGSAVRVSPVAYIANSLFDVQCLAKRNAEITHNHPEGIKGAEAVASAVYLAKIGKTKKYIINYIIKNYYKEISSFDYNELIEKYKFSESCQSTVPQAIYVFSISTSFEDAIRKALTIGGDSDTVCSIVGSIAEAYYRDIPKWLKTETFIRLDASLIKIINKFYEKNIY
jgi:ADP-ribosylglycohydrolase